MPEQHRMNFQETRSADATYVSLSDQSPSRRHQPGSEGNTEPPKAVRYLEESVIAGSHRPVRDVLEDIPHIREAGVIGKWAEGALSPETLITRPELGESVAKSLHLSPAHLTKYFTYYGHPEVKRNMDQSETSRPFDQRDRLLSCAVDEKLKAFCRADLPLEALLQALNDEQAVLVRRHVRWMGRRYRIPLVKIAKLVVNFPEISFERKMESDEKYERAEKAGQDDDQQRQKTDYSLRFRTGFSLASVSQYIQYLVDEQILSEDHALRYVAARLRIPTCRLSKLRTYYCFKGA
jgi:hypothetical protein